jgi:hypothetical protein
MGLISAKWIEVRSLWHGASIGSKGRRKEETWKWILNELINPLAVDQTNVSKANDPFDIPVYLLRPKPTNEATAPSMQIRDLHMDLDM